MGKHLARDRGIAHRLKEALFHSFWKAEKMEYAADSNAIVMHAPSGLLHARMPCQAGRACENRRKKRLAGRCQETTLPPGRLIALAEPS